MAGQSPQSWHGLSVEPRISVGTLAGLFIQSVIIAIGFGFGFAILRSDILTNANATLANRDRIAVLEHRVQLSDNAIARLEERIIAMGANITEIKDLLKEMRGAMAGAQSIPR